LANPDSPAES